MVWLLILLGLVVLLACRKRISRCLEGAEGPIGRFMRRNNRPPQELNE